MNETTLSGILLTRPKDGSAKPMLGKRRFRLLFILGVALLVLAIAAGVLPRLSQRRQATADAKQLELQTVSVVSPSVGAPPDGLMLPAEVKPWQEASIYSRVNRNFPRAFSEVRSNLNNSGLS